MKGRIADGKIGDVRIITGSYQQDWLLYDTDYSWRLEPDMAGNSCAIADIGSHWMDAVQHVTGHRITEVMADLKTVIPVRKKPKQQVETFSDNLQNMKRLRFRTRNTARLCSIPTRAQREFIMFRSLRQDTDVTSILKSTVQRHRSDGIRKKMTVCGWD